MPIRYRCRCGQEVVLRPREGFYLVAGLILVLTVLNSALTLTIWLRDPAPAGERNDSGLASRDGSDGDPVETGSPARERPGPARAEDPARRVRLPASLVAATESGTAGEGGEDDGERMLPVRGRGEAADESGGGAPPAEDSSNPRPPTSVRERAGAGHTISSARSAIGDRESSAAAERVAPALPERVELTRPVVLDGIALHRLAISPPAKEEEIRLVRLAAVRWGAGWVRDRARIALEGEIGEFGAILRRSALLRGRAVRDPERPSPSLDGLVLKASSPSALLAALRDEWETTWPRILPDPSREPEWAASARRVGDAATDLVFLVDLSESMAVETPAVTDTLRRLLPMLSSSERRWAWVGFRDEVVDRVELHDDVNSFLATLERWRCEGGGDVPEGVDRALFEALRFGSFGWRPEASHRFVLIGDAPPPFERIEGAISILRAAHRSPEAYRLDAIGILREEEFDRVPSFDELAAAGAGRARHIPEGEALPPVLWDLLVGGEPPPDFSRDPASRRK